MGYSGNQVKTLGECFSEFSLNNNKFIHKFLIVESHKVNLIGRDICSLLNCFFSIPDKIKINNVYDKILGNFQDYLSPEFISCVSEKIELRVGKEVKPILVIKKDGNIRLTGDFSRTVNPSLSMVNAKLISVDDVISQIGDAK